MRRSVVPRGDQVRGTRHRSIGVGRAACAILGVEAENGEKAIEVAKREEPDIILMDLSLPVLDGIAATQKIRATEGFNGVPVIAVTAHQEMDFREGAKAAGFAAYVTKPIDMNWLSELIKGLLV